MTRYEISNMPPGPQINALITTRIFNVDGFWHGIKPYSTDISAAWEVFEKMKSRGELRIHFDGDNWICFIGGDSYGASSDYAGGEMGIADTASLAICRAALLTVMETECPKE